MEISATTTKQRTLHAQQATRVASSAHCNQRCKHKKLAFAAANNGASKRERMLVVYVRQLLAKGVSEQWRLTGENREQWLGFVVMAAGEEGREKDGF